QSGTFTATFDASPSLSPSNTVIGLSKGTQTAYTGLSCIARFNASGDIDAYNGTSGYQAASVIPYSKGLTYHFRMAVNVPASTYSVYVTPPGGSELTVGLNYGFRKAATSLDTWTIDVNSTPGGSVTVSNRTISGSGGTVAAPSFSPGAGTYSSAQTVIINDSTSGASIRYTTDNSTPSETNGTVYSGSISISSTTTLKAIAYETGMTDSTVTSGLYTINITSRSLAGSSSNGFQALALSSAQAGTFTATFDATPSVSPENGVIGLSKGVATTYTGLSCLARFNPSGDIDAYNGTAYAAAATIPYSAGVTYHFRLVVNVSAHTYSVYVTPPGGSELMVGLNDAFRSTANTVTSLDTWNLDLNSTPANCSLTANNLSP
ncbi:MAG TPA: chitobiase/beta-hexosaminidase C-terminal domain-containing protein, partial [Opitutaceae bacterium]|nr:chitobiase/beta-hexosaminidase C-terminal domain-containing protein [Opitutaceae bacterium]